MQKDELTLRENFSATLRELRYAAGLTQEEVAHKAGISVSHVGGLERGTLSPSLIVLYRLAKALNRTPQDLLRKID